MNLPESAAIAAEAARLGLALGFESNDESPCDGDLWIGRSPEGGWGNWPDVCEGAGWARSSEAPVVLETLREAQHFEIFCEFLPGKGPEWCADGALPINGVHLVFSDFPRSTLNHILRFVTMARKTYPGLQDRDIHLASVRTEGGRILYGIGFMVAGVYDRCPGGFTEIDELKHEF